MYRYPRKTPDTAFAVCEPMRLWRWVSIRILNQYIKGTRLGAFSVLAERMGFEPMIPVRVYTISSRAP